MLLDISGSMGEPGPGSEYHSKIAELNAARTTLPNEILKDEHAASIVRAATITFGGDVKVVQGFVPADRIHLPRFEANGLTPMAEGILQAFDLAEEGLARAEKRDQDTYGPWIFMVTDGQSTSSREMMAKARQRIYEGERNPNPARRIAFFAVGVEGADMEELARLSMRRPLKLMGYDYKRMFAWLAESLKEVSRSQPGDKVTLPDHRPYDIEMK
ncbi:MAG: hypothetical protein IRY99_11520 [Isosphaeraceae bacterium]|nr:hypothetical protein [Isosphaeraceae bacterium]